MSFSAISHRTRQIVEGLETRQVGRAAFRVTPRETREPGTAIVVGTDQEDCPGTRGQLLPIVRAVRQPTRVPVGEANPDPLIPAASPETARVSEIETMSNGSEAPVVSGSSVPIRVLVVDDDRGARLALEVPLRLSGYSVTAVADGLAALELAKQEPFDLLLTDVYMPGMNGLELVQQFRLVSPRTKIIVLTGQGSVTTALKSVEHGALDFLAKPFDIDEVLALVHRATAVEETPIEDESRGPQFSASGIIGHSPEMVRVYKLIAYAARSKATVLIEGETGTGKELAARAIHTNSERAQNPFVAVNCSALTETLLESELFGHVKGSFTGADQDRPGLFEGASGGSIFLDEIGTADPSLQSSLLRVLQEQEIRRVGSTQSIKVDVRVIAASNKDLEGLVEAGSFRADLYYRLSVLTLKIPPLRTRGRNDLELLTTHLLNKHAVESGAPLRFSEDAFEIIAGYIWPGNVRELENTIQYAIAICNGDVITIRDLPLHIIGSSNPQNIQPRERPVSLTDDRPTIEELSKRYVRLILAESGGNKSQAAAILGINRRTLYRYLDGSTAIDKSDSTPAELTE